MSKCGKSCMPECEYFTTGGCISPFNCPYRIEELSPNSATSISSTYVQNLISENAVLKAENAALKKRLDNANDEIKAKEKEIIQKIYEAIKLVDCLQYNPSVDFNYLRAKGVYNIIKNQVEHIEAENTELRARLDNAVELPCVKMVKTKEWIGRVEVGDDLWEWAVIYIDRQGEFVVEPCRSKAEAEARLEELKGGRE